MSRSDTDFSTWMSNTPAFSAGGAQWLWNDFWLLDYLDPPAAGTDREGIGETVESDPAEDGDTADTVTLPENGDDPIAPAVVDDPAPEEDPLDGGRDEDTGPGDAPDTGEDEEDDGPGDDPLSDPAPDPAPETEPDETLATSGHVGLASGPLAALLDPFGHFVSLMSDRFGGLDMPGAMSAASHADRGPLDTPAPPDEFIFIPSDPEPVTPSLDDLALSDLLPDEPDAAPSQLPVDDWFF